MADFSDERIAQALTQPCDAVCGVPVGCICVNPVTGKPLVEETGKTVHARRLEL
jgi:hypothetical protein